MRRKSETYRNVLPINQHSVVRGFLLFVVIFLSMSIGCTKVKNIPTNYIPQDLKDCLIFKSGSYWVYLKESNGTIDSNYVIGEPVYTTRLMGFGKTDSYSQQCKTIYDGSFIDSVIIIQNNYSFYLNNFLFSGSESTTFIPGKILNPGPKDTLKGVAVLDTMTINNNLFQNIYVTQYSSVTVSSKPYVCTAYFIKNIGLIRFDLLYNGNTIRWSLLRYKAVQ